MYTSYRALILQPNRLTRQKKALDNHVGITHQGLRPFACPVSNCGMVFGYKHVMQRHLSRKHSRGASESDLGAQDEALESHQSEESGVLDLLTGKQYLKTRTTQRAKRLIPCPWPHMLAANRTSSASVSDKPGCSFVFSRIYDLRRHLRAEHDLEVDQSVLDEALNSGDLRL